jgi:translocation and assembly module TamB
MSRSAKILRNIAIGIAVFIVVLVAGTTVVVQTGWFRNYVKQRIITAAEEGTGGQVEIGSFAFEWQRLRAIVTEFVIHGSEPAGSAPFIRAQRVELNLRVLTSLSHMLDLAYLGVDRPEANILVFPDGHTNVPTPKKASTSNTTALETVVDLAVRHFEFTNGLLTLNSQKQALNVRGDNLRAQLWYSVLKRGYEGQISLEPLYLIAGRNTPVKFALTLPIALGRDRIDLRDAKISTAASQILINASVENRRNLKTSAHIAGRLALADLKNAGDLPVALDADELLATMDLEASAVIADNTIQVTGLRLAVGHSHIEASGKLKDPNGNGSLEFKAQLAVGELGRLARLTARPDGTVALTGMAKLDANNNYQVTGNLEAKDVSFLAGSPAGTQRVSLFSGVRLAPHRLDLGDLRLIAFGGEVAGNASLEDFARYKVKGNLRHLDLRTAASAMGQKNFAYAGVASGPIAAEGDLNLPGTKSITAHAWISIAPGSGGIPVSGRVYADYTGAADNINISDSYVTLPHTRVTLSGSPGNRLDVALTTRDLDDLLAAASLSDKPPVTLDAGGQATLTSVVTGSLTSPHIAAHLAANRFSVEGRHFETLALDAGASSSGAAVSNGSLNRGAMQAQFTGSVGLRNWKATPNDPLSGDVSIHDGDLADIMATTGRQSAGYSGALSATVNVSGTVGNPLGTADLLVANGTIQGEPFDQIQAQVNMADQLITVPAAHAAAGPARVTLTAEFQHPRESFTTGRLHARVQTSRVNLAQFRTLQRELPNTSGELQVQADVTGNLLEAKSGAEEHTEFLLTGVSADASARGLRFEGQNYGDFNATARTTRQMVHYDVASDFAGSKITLNGDTELVRDYPTKADATIGNLPIERLLALAKRTDIPARGNLSCAIHFTGTKENPQGNVDLELANAVLYDEPIEHVRARVAYLAQSIDVPQFEIVSGPSRLAFTAKYDHPAGDLQAGNVQFRVNSAGIDLARIRNVQKMRPGLGGTLQIAANGAATVRQAETRVLFHDLAANVTATGIAAQGKNFGDLTLTANTTAGRLNFALDSNLAEASIHGRGNAELGGDYPLTAELTFNNVTWTRLQALLGPGGGEPPSFEAVADGQATASGPATKTDDLRGSLKLTRLNLNAIPLRREGPGPIVVQNQGPIAVTVDRGVARIESLHLTGPETDIQARGTASLHGKALDMTLNANTNLAAVKQLNRDVVSSGSVVLAATVRGALTEPLVNGRLELHDASLSYTGFPNGISNANGVVQFNGNSASVQNLTAESGGGKITMGGFVAFRDVVRFGLRANATNVRVRLQEGVSAALDANINLAGTTQASTVSGTVTIDRVTYAPQSDFGSMLSRAAPPVESTGAPSPLLDNMKLDVQVRTSPSTTVRTSLAQHLQAEADLRIRGTASQPGMLGRVSVTEGQLVFFGSTYTVNSGTIAFYNPVRIEPVLNLSLETQAKGVDVVLKVTGPVDNMKLSYTSDPPLQFQEIVELLASGKTPTSDPTLLANQPSAPSQSFAQMGESAVVSKALADPVAGRLQRVFGVSQLKVDPTFTNGSDLPQARLTLQQQVSNNITFTYVTALNDPNTQIVRVEWALNPQWSAIGTRDQNGIFSVKFSYKKQFR